MMQLSRVDESERNLKRVEDILAGIQRDREQYYTSAQTLNSDFELAQDKIDQVKSFY
jgi:hypothetical protein